MLDSKPKLLLLLLIVFAANYVETAVESSLHPLSAPLSEAAFKAAYAVQHFEPAFVNFEYHHLTNRGLIIAYSIAYFGLLPALGIGVLVALLRREEIGAARVLCLAVAIDYAISLPWFLLFPVPERWAYPESSAMLLSDIWDSRLIVALRPISGLDNCFPSTHVSLTVILVAVCWLYEVKLRNTITAFGLMVVISTFTLGIHWLADIVAGVVIGVVSVFASLRLLRASERLRIGWPLKVAYRSG